MTALRTLSKKLIGVSSMTALRISAVLTLIGLALMAWSMLQPTPLPVMLAMTVGQGIGCMAFGLYLLVVIRDILRVRRAPRSDERDLP